MVSKVAVIPARGGSVRLKGKNIYPLGGKPLIQHTIEAVIGANSFDAIYVSTNDPAIAAVAREFPQVQVFQRPEEYSGSKVTVLEALLAMMKEIPHHDVFAYFLPTCPFRNSSDVRAGLDLLTPDIDSVYSICKFEEPIQLALIKHGEEVIPVYDNLKLGATNSQYITPHYRPNGGFYMSWWDKLVVNKNFFVGKTKAHEMPKERSVDIDDYLDMMFAEQVLMASMITRSQKEATVVV
jgi:CMP-N,N'-diacetyllegionaminic acid synthase